MVGTDEVWLGKLCKLRYLPKKIANFVHEFHSGDFPNLNLPPLPSNCCSLNVHAMLTGSESPPCTSNSSFNISSSY